MQSENRELGLPRWWLMVVLIPWAGIGLSAMLELVSWRVAGFVALTWVLIWLAVLSQTRRS